MTLFRCKMCGGSLEVFEGSSTAVCEYCGSQQTLPKLSDEKIVRLYDRANHFRMNNEFDKAMGIYEQILDEQSNDSEAYWSLVLCRYGVEYVNDPQTHKRVPTVNRTQLVPILSDPDYEMALKYADLSQKLIYEAEAKAINEIQEGIFAFSRQEEPFDVFISYKETDDNTGLRTQDSIDALEVFYLPLIKKGYNVFYAPMTLKEKHIPQGKYDAYIFSALSSAKVMIVLGSRKEYFEAEWVKNEWGRYLDRIMKNGEKKDIIPVYRNISPDQLPDKLRAFEAFDLTKPDTLFYIMQKIEYSIPRSMTPRHTFAAPSKQQEVNSNTVTVDKPAMGNVNALLKRVSIFLENGDWSNADIYCEKVLDNDPENGQAYVYKLFAQARVTELEALRASQVSLDSLSTYKNAVRYSDEATSATLIQYNQDIKQSLERLRLEREAQLRREREISELKEKQRRVGVQLTNQVNRKKSIEEQIEQKQNRINAKFDIPKLTRSAKFVRVLALMSVIALIIVIIAGVASDGESAAFVLFLLLWSGLCVWYYLACAKLARLNNNKSHLTWINLPTYGVFGVIYASVILKKIKKGNIINKELEDINALQAQIVAVDEDIEKSKKALNEIYSKLCELEN